VDWQRSDLHYDITRLCEVSADVPSQQASLNVFAFSPALWACIATLPLFCILSINLKYHPRC